MNDLSKAFTICLFIAGATAGCNKKFGIRSAKAKAPIRANFMNGIVKNISLPKLKDKIAEDCEGYPKSVVEHTISCESFDDSILELALTTASCSRNVNHTSRSRGSSCIKMVRTLAVELLIDLEGSYFCKYRDTELDPALYFINVFDEATLWLQIRRYNVRSESHRIFLSQLAQQAKRGAVLKAIFNP